MFIIYLNIKFDMAGSNGSLVITIELLKTEYISHNNHVALRSIKRIWN
jgi:hypothetical protein